MIEKEQFLASCYLTEEDLEKANIEWSELAAIECEYAKIEEHLRNLGKDFIDEYLYDIDKAGIHSYRYRTKAPGHLLEKVIRKKKENPDYIPKEEKVQFADKKKKKRKKPKSISQCIAIIEKYNRENGTHYSYGKFPYPEMLR